MLVFSILVWQEIWSLPISARINLGSYHHYHNPGVLTFKTSHSSFNLLKEPGVKKSCQLKLYFCNFAAHAKYPTGEKFTIGL